ncbi:MAG: hypothetical protein JXB43_03525 [Dehalococcoidia bacterium]|nr:hypothetical protein [Dehalococcoidia bacterium]
MYKPVESEAQRLRRYEVDAVLDSISKASAWRRSDEKGFAKALAKEKLDYKAALRDFQLAFAVKLVLHFSDKSRLSSRRFTWRDLLEACRSLVKHQEPSSYPLISLEDADKFFMRAAYQQFPDFYGDSDTFARTHLLFRTCAHVVEKAKSFDVDGAYAEATGLTLDQAWDITLALYGLLISKRGGIQPGPLTAGDLKQNITNDDLARFFNLVSLTPEEFKTKMRLPIYQLDPCESFNPNPLVTWPIIKLRGNRWVTPILPYLFRRGTEQIFYDVIARKGREFAGFFGYVFEEYVDRILGTLDNAYQVIREIRYVRDGQPCDTCDRIVIRKGDAVLVECKTKRLKLKTKFTADEQLLRDDLTDVAKDDDKSSIVSAIRQLYRTEHDIRRNCGGLEELNKLITGRMYPVVLVLDPYYLANASYIKRVITEELKKGDVPVTNYEWQIVDAHGFERLCSLSQSEDFINLIAKKFSVPELAIQDMETYVDNFVMQRRINRDVLVHPAIKTELQTSLEEIKTRYGIKLGN